MLILRKVSLTFGKFSSFSHLCAAPMPMMITEQSSVENFHKHNTHIKTPLNFFSVVWSIKWEKLQRTRARRHQEESSTVKNFPMSDHHITFIYSLPSLPTISLLESRVMLTLTWAKLSRPHSFAVSSTCCKEKYILFFFCVFDDDRHCRVENIIKLIENIFRYISVAKVARSLDSSSIFFFDIIRVGVREKREKKCVLLCRAQNVNEKRRTKADPSLFCNLCNYHQHIYRPFGSLLHFTLYNYSPARDRGGKEWNTYHFQYILCVLASEN